MCVCGCLLKRFCVSGKNWYKKFGVGDGGCGGGGIEVVVVVVLW